MKMQMDWVLVAVTGVADARLQQLAAEAVTALGGAAQNW